MVTQVSETIVVKKENDDDKSGQYSIAQQEETCRELKKHNKTRTGKKSYSCETYEKTFARSDSLKIHNRIHIGEKPFSCEIC